MTSIPLGRYRHYKGNEYTVLGIARHSETLEELVVYRPEYGAGDLWVRPRQMFLETVTVDGQQVPRFRRLDAEPTVEPLLVGNLLANLPADVPEEVLQSIMQAPGLRMERIVSRGQSSPEGFWYDQDQREFVVLVSGAARLRFEDGAIELTPGSYLDIPPHRRHRVEWTTPDEPTIWLAIHLAEEK